MTKRLLKGLLMRVSLPEIAQYSPYYLPLNVLIASKGSNLYILFFSLPLTKKVQVGNDQEKAQSEKKSHSKNRSGKKQTNNKALIP